MFPFLDEEVRTAYDSLMLVLEAANNWCDYLDDQGREDEIGTIERAIGVLASAAVKP